MKKIFLITALVAANIAPAHAISESYRRQLEKSHTTQVSDANGYKTQATHTYRGQGLTVKRTGDQVYVDGKAAALDETTPQAQTYSAGTKQIIFYKKGRVSVMDSGRYVGDLK